MKLGIFTDAHYSSQEVTCGNRYNSQSLEKIRQAYESFAREQCDLVICLGDLTDREDSHEEERARLCEIAEVIGESGIPTVCVMGNHDAFDFTREEFYGILRGCRPENRLEEGRNLIFLDACYCKDGRSYQPGDSDWTDTYLPETEKLEALLAQTRGDVYLFMHQNIDPQVEEHHCLANAEQVRAILEKNGRVRRVWQGHYHPGVQSVYGSTEYITLPAMCEGEKTWVVAEI